MRYNIINSNGRIVGTVNTESAERALEAHLAMIGHEQGLHAVPALETRSVEEAALEFAHLLRKEYFEKGGK